MRDDPILCNDGEHDLQPGRFGCSPVWLLCTKCPYHEPAPEDHSDITIEIISIDGTRIISRRDETLVIKPKSAIS